VISARGDESIAARDPRAADAIDGAVVRSTWSASRTAAATLFLRDLVVLRKHLGGFAYRTLIQPFFLVFVFLYVFPRIGQSVGGTGSDGPAFATVLVPGVAGLSIQFQGVTTTALELAQEFGFTREIEDRVQAPCPIELVALVKVASGAIQAILAAIIVLPVAAVVHAGGVHADISVHWLAALTLIPLAAVMMSSLGLVLGTTFDPRNIGLMWGYIVVPAAFLGGTYYRWANLAPVRIGGFPWLQIMSLANPLIYVNEGLRGALTNSEHLPFFVIYPALAGLTAAFMLLGLRGFRRRVLS
jgi:ABC-2 type transport system permease protein